ncbi:Crp/Fnr family transcriptional regulator [Sulfitobacter sp. 1A12126]|uniref:Crp/Fnr family transcriptional regulator n=1 Tax=Sulfitobacter sp. 1A12126 TaxID=3368591 RepID=UPI0037475EEC
MMTKSLSSCPSGQNNLLRTLSDDDRAMVSPHLKRVPLNKGTFLEEANTPLDIIYFPVSGVGSTVAFSKGGRRIEVGLFGREGMSGSAIVLQGKQSSNETFMQVGGEGFALEAEKLSELMAQSPTLQRHLLRYMQTILTQTLQTALSNGQAKLEERLARWLLMCHDRINSDELHLTHEFLSIMLGVRRAGVTVGTHILEGRGMIRAKRGRITILDRKGLEAEAKESYGIPESEYVRLIGFE